MTVCAITVTIEVRVTVFSAESVVPVASTPLAVDGDGRTDPGFPQLFLVLLVAAVVPVVVPMAGALVYVGPPAVVDDVPAVVSVGMVIKYEPDKEGFCS